MDDNYGTAAHDCARYCWKRSWPDDALLQPGMELKAMGTERNPTQRKTSVSKRLLPTNSLGTELLHHPMSVFLLSSAPSERCLDRFSILEDEHEGDDGLVLCRPLLVGMLK
ncbi:hypothetical protein JDV02_000467 [Purpureocillium takamizusanense]|uniref:Uncharacterized protein n=1 Tax=Purpureocillium takamizusanense TaxID=2060973 RepID=A0A9Q8Q6P6_9HYPO|nr:uncharacterized protein JDV02_000467 [Purpureocillium takamizusanense]UNI13752.1 hypothetical protein JDV02_000467 [Purpureocillium takamizusanense]